MPIGGNARMKLAKCSFYTLILYKVKELSSEMPVMENYKQKIVQREDTFTLANEENKRFFL